MFKYNDGGRSNYFKGDCGDCVTRAIAIATGRDYKEVYNFNKKVLGYTPRNGVRSEDTTKLLKKWGFKPHKGTKICHSIKLNKEDLPSGMVICRIAHHLVAVEDGVALDTWDCTKNGERAVLEYWD